MAYVRFGVDGSQVYIFDHSPMYDCPNDDCVRCHNCPLLNGSPTWHFHTTELHVMLDHLTEHRAAGHCVPDWVEEELRADWPTLTTVADSAETREHEES